MLRLALCCILFLSVGVACDSETLTVEDIESWVQNLNNRKEDVGATEFEHQALLESLEQYLLQLEKEKEKNEME